MKVPDLHIDTRADVAAFNAAMRGKVDFLRYLHRKSRAAAARVASPLARLFDPLFQAAVAAALGPATAVSVVHTGLGIIDVRAKGAKGDGVTDDAAAIQAAIDAANAAGGGVVDLPPATYVVASGLVMKANVTLRGAGAGSHLNAASVAAGASILSFSGVSKAAVVGVRITGNNLSSSTGGGIVVTSGCSYIAVEDCEVYQANVGVRIGGGSRNVHVARNRILNAAGTVDSGYGILCGGNDGVNPTRRVTIEDNYIDTPGRHGIYLSGDGLEIGIYRNRILSAGYHGLQAYIDDGAHVYGMKRVVISGNEFTSSAYGGVLIHNGNSGALLFEDFTVDGNNIATTGNSEAGISLRSTRNARISYNRVHAASGNGILVNEHTSNKVSQGHAIVGNVVTSAGIYGIFVEESDHCSVVGNVVRSSTSDGIRVTDGDYSIVSANVLESNGAYGLRVTAVGVVIGPNSFRSNTTGAFTSSEEWPHYTVSRTLGVAEYRTRWNATAAALTVTLPAAASVAPGLPFTFKKTDSTANAVTIDASGAETIDGTTTVQLLKQYESCTIVSDGSTWHRTDRADAITVDNFEAAQLEKVSAKGAASGYAGLDSSGYVPVAQLPTTIQYTTQKGAASGYASLDANTRVTPAQLALSPRSAAPAGGSGGTVAAITALEPSADRAYLIPLSFGARLQPGAATNPYITFRATFSDASTRTVTQNPAVTTRYVFTWGAATISGVTSLDMATLLGNKPGVYCTKLEVLAGADTGSVTLDQITADGWEA